MERAAVVFRRAILISTHRLDGAKGWTVTAVRTDFAAAESCANWPV